jgi:hypothetical protein
MRRIIFAAAVAILAFPTGSFAAPRALYGKHVVVSWTETRSQRNPGETAFHPVSLPFTLTFYVGNEGHVFKRMFSVGSTGKASGSQDRVGNKPAGDISASSASFSGNTLTATSAFGGAARRMQITFDGNFSSCSAQVTTAKLSGAKSVSVRSIASGNIVEFESVSAGAASCSVGEGNPFAN